MQEAESIWQMKSEKNRKVLILEELTPYVDDNIMKLTLHFQMIISLHDYFYVCKCQ